MLAGRLLALKSHARSQYRRRNVSKSGIYDRHRASATIRMSAGRLARLWQAWPDALAILKRVDERVLAHRLGIPPRGRTDTRQFSRGDGPHAGANEREAAGTHPIPLDRPIHARAN